MSSGRRDGVALGVSLAVLGMGLAVLVVRHAHLPTLVQIPPGLIPMQYNTALCFLALGVAGIGVALSVRPLVFAGGVVVAVLGGAVILEYATGLSSGVDTLFFLPSDQALSAHAGRMAFTTAIGFGLTGVSLVGLALRAKSRVFFGIASAAASTDEVTRPVDTSPSEAMHKTLLLQSAIFSSPTFACIVVDAVGAVQIFSVGAQRMLGYSAAEAIEALSPTDLVEPHELIRRAQGLSREFGSPVAPGLEAMVYKAARGIEDVYDLTCLRKDGSRFPAHVSVTALRDAQNEIIGYLLVGTDDTLRNQIEEARKRLEQRLRDQQFYTRSLIESSIDAMMTTDPDGIITDVNEQMEALTGCTRAALIGSPFKGCFTDTARAQAAIVRVLAEGRLSDFELTARALDGTLALVSYNASTFRDRTGALQGVFAAARDVTERKHIELALVQKNLELEDASRMKSEFLANMSHELRTPLNAIIGFSEVLGDGLIGDLTHKQRGFIADIFSSGKHLLSLINDILDLSKVEAGKMVLELETLDLPIAIASSLAIIREKATGRNIEVELQTAEDLGAIEADGRKLKQILYNLLFNAIKFSNDGGHVTLRARRVPREQVGRVAPSGAGRCLPLGDSPFAEFLELSVTDTGIGIAEDGMSRLFQPFSQIDGGVARRFEGTGLGLAMVKLLAELHGGTVAVESAIGVGSCFSVWLPLRPPKAASIELSVAHSALHVPLEHGQRKALVVEDDARSAELIRVQLEAEGFSVIVVTTAEEALVIAAHTSLSLITLDIMLPNMDGWAFLSRVKQSAELRRIPVVIISIVADRNKGFSLGAAAIMQKPISRLELYESLVDIGLFPVVEGQSLKVLVVDDDPKAVELIATRMQGLASTVLRAYGGREAITAAREEAPDVIVLDLMMPVTSGFDVVAALSEKPETARIPILVVTAKEITAEDRASLDGSVSAIMEKVAFDGERFASEIRRAMAGRGMASL
jgi:PAS domain S-box-containing protein